MRVLVTGGAGFIGAHFIRSWLAYAPADEVINLDGLTYAGSLGRLADVDQHPHYRFVQADLNEVDQVREALRGCQLIVHFAAETHVDRSITDAEPFLRTNVQGTAGLLHAALAANVSRFVHVSTDEVYGPIVDGAVTEQALLSPRSPYAASKAAADLLVQAYQHTYGLPTIVVRPTNIFGPGQFPEKFIPLTITRASQEQPIPLYGDGQQQRSWLFVTDVCRAIQTVIERGTIGGVYNIAGGQDQTNYDTATQILAQLRRSPALIEFVADRPGHDRRYAMDDTRLRQLGWAPSVPFEHGLAETITWYQAHPAWWRPLTERLREDPYHWLNRSAGSGAGSTSGAIR